MVVGVLLFAHIIHTLGLVVGYGITIEKKGKLYLGVSGTGALINTILNFILVQRFSFMGAAVATLCTEIIIFVVSYYFSK
ncbi:MAG: polysaccharide biosynthesis C-terminal domain-containing protein, partial [Coprobacillus cateniformis]